VAGTGYYSARADAAIQKNRRAVGHEPRGALHSVSAVR
jgi:hypothetical protein